MRKILVLLSMIASLIILTACGTFQNVSFYDGETVLSTSTIRYGTTVSRPTWLEIKSGHTFESWNVGDVEYKFDEPVVSDLRISGVWVKGTSSFEFAEVSFVIESISLPKVSVAIGGNLVLPTEPTKTGFDFDGWYIDNTFTTKFDLNTTINESLTLYARWLEQATTYYEVKFLEVDETVITILPKVPSNTTLSRPATPTKEGKLFTGWYIDKALTTLYSFDVKVTSNLILYAKWIDRTSGNFNGYYDAVATLSGSALQIGLRTLIDKPAPSYDVARQVLQIADADPNNNSKVLTIYDRRSVNKGWDGGTTWNREHVWPQSKLNNAPVGELHNLRAATPSVNSSRGNLAFEDSTSNACGRINGGWFPGRDDRGDVARIVFFMITRYSQLTMSTMGNLNVLLKWNIDDPVDYFEAVRNEAIFDYQKNRNPFIDHPEYANNIFGAYRYSLSDFVQTNKYTQNFDLVVKLYSNVSIEDK